MSATVFADSDPITPLWSAEVGALPPDPNRPIEGFPLGDVGRYADALIRDQIVRNDTLSGMPRFTLPPLSLSDGQYAELTVIMLPKVWLEKKTVPISNFDQAAYTTFVMLLLNAAGGGLV